jgi:hypothetical protein
MGGNRVIQADPMKERLVGEDDQASLKDRHSGQRQAKGHGGRKPGSSRNGANSDEGNFGFPRGNRGNYNEGVNDFPKKNRREEQLTIMRRRFTVADFKQEITEGVNIGVMEGNNGETVTESNKGTPVGESVLFLDISQNGNQANSV